MSELIIELFSEEMPPKLQTSAKDNLIDIILKFLNYEEIRYDKNYSSFSTPNRLVIYFKNIHKEVLRRSKEIKGPNINSTDKALQGFLKSNEISKKNVYKKKLLNGEFYFYRTVKTKIKTKNLLEKNVPIFLNQIKWKKSMKWGYYNLFWGRPLKSIMAIYNKKPLNFKFHHLKSSNSTFIDKNSENSKKIFKDFKSYKKFFKTNGIIIDNNERKNFIEKDINKFLKLNNYKARIKDKLINEVTNIVEKPKVFLCSFNKRFLKMPEELINYTIESHQKFFLVYDKDYKLTDKFLIVANCEDKKGYIKKGNERVIEARLSDAEYFWNKNKSINMIKQVFKLQKINYFNGLGSYFEKVQRLKKLGSILSDEMLISKEKIEIASTISKVDLLSELINEFPELQGILGGYFAESQGFDKDVSLSLMEQYLPTGVDSRIPKNSYSIALSLSDKIDTLVGFFGINLKPSSSKDPYALRRLAIGIIKIIIENKKYLKLNELINSSLQIYKNQSILFDDKKIFDELSKFFLERFKNYMKDKGIRQDIIETSTINFDLNKLLMTYKKAYKLNKVIGKRIGLDLIGNYKRAFNILNTDKSSTINQMIESADPALFKNEYEKNLYNKLNDVRKNFSNIKVENDYDTQLTLLASIKVEISNFFENVIVNDSDETIKNNRLQLLKMVCKTFDNYFSFEKIESYS